MTELQQQFLDLRFGMYIHLNMATFRAAGVGRSEGFAGAVQSEEISTPISGRMLPARQGWRMAA